MRRGHADVPRAGGDAQPLPMEAAGHAGARDARWIHVRRCRSGRGHRGDGGHRGQTMRVGDRAVPRLRPRRARSSTSTCGSPSKAIRSPRREPSATSPTTRCSPSTRRWATTRSTGAASSSTMPAGVPAPEDCPHRVGGSDPPALCSTGWTSGIASGRRPRPARRHARRRSLADVGAHPGGHRPASTPPRWPCSATSCPSASARRSGIRGGGNSLDNTLRIVRTMATAVGPARHPRAGRRARLRPRRDPHVRHRRHAARDGQPELHRPLLARRRAATRSDRSDQRRTR